MECLIYLSLNRSDIIHHQYHLSNTHSYQIVPYNHQHAIFWALSMDAFICIPLIILLFRNLDKIEQFHSWDNVTILGGNHQQNTLSAYQKIEWNEIFARNWFVIKKQWGWIIFGIILTFWHDFATNIAYMWHSPNVRYLYLPSLC